MDEPTAGMSIEETERTGDLIKRLNAGGVTILVVEYDMAIGAGEIAGLIGCNGVGKTTTMRCLIGELPAAAGRIRFRGKDMTGLKPDVRARRGVGYIPQGRNVFLEMTVVENIQVGELIGGKRGRKLNDLVYEYFPVLTGRRSQAAGTLSGGEQQQFAIGRALVSAPSLMLLDEPSEGIQPSIVAHICDRLKAIHGETGVTILFAEQNLDTIHAIGERAYAMEKGRIVAEIGGEGVRDPQVIREHLLI